MTKEEALKLAIDGEKVRYNLWTPSKYVYWDMVQLLLLTEDRHRPAGIYVFPEDDWEIYKEPSAPISSPVDNAWQQLLSDIDTSLNKMRKLYEEKK